MEEVHYNCGNITGLLKELSEGSRAAMDELIPLVNEELHRQAHLYLKKERKNHTLQTTALVNEAYLKLIEQKSVNWQNRAHFFGIAATMMRRILVNYAKNRNRLKRGGPAENLTLDEGLTIAANERNIDLIALDEALNELAKLDEQQAKIVELRYFSGMTIKETAEYLRISPTTVKKGWRMARAWLKAKLTVGAAA